MLGLLPVVAMDALAASPLGILTARGCLRLVTDVVHEDDALCLALGWCGRARATKPSDNLAL